MTKFTRSYTRYYSADFLENDGRHHLWVRSFSADATLVYDRHNVLYAYGPLEEFKAVLRQEGLHEGVVRFPSPHSHHYNAAFDEAEKEILAFQEWRRFPLTEQDEE